MTPPSNLDDLRPRWTEAERQMYPLATVSPEKYQQLVRLARQVADSLSTVSTGAELAERWNDATAIVERAAADIGLPIGDLPAENVAGVGFALRDGELRAEAHRQAMIERIAGARAAGDQWVRLHETGDLAHGLLSPYSSIELHIPSGAAVVASVEPNPVDGSTNHVLTVIRMDSTTGEPVDIDPGIAEDEEHRDAESFTAAHRALIDRLSD